MGRKPHSNFNLPQGMRARKRTRKNGETVIYYFFDGRDANGKRKEYPLGKDYIQAIQQWTQLAVEKLPTSQAITFELAAAKYNQDITAYCATNSQNSIKHSIKKLTEFFGGDAPLDKIEPQHIKQYLHWRKAAPSSANIELGYFSAIFNYAREMGCTNKPNPCLGIKKNPKKRRDIYIEDKLYNLVYQAADQQIRDLMDMAYLTGQRPIDIVKIHTNNIYDNILHITQQKTKTKMRFALNTTLHNIIQRNAPTTGGYLFCNKHKKPLTTSTLSNYFKKLRKTLIQQYPQYTQELQNFQFRDLRAKAGTDTYLKNGSTAAKEQLGHINEQTTKIYIRKTKILQPLEPICGTHTTIAEK